VEEAEAKHAPFLAADWGRGMRGDGVGGYAGI
jgi:hypothetical protein